MPATPINYILISAHHCAPDMGSEHAVGWNLVSRLARLHPILLITQDNEYRKSIEDGIEKLREEGAEIKAFFVRHKSQTDGRRNNLRVRYYLTYRNYQRNVFLLARKLVSEYNIVAIHHLTIVGFREPGFLWRINRPFIWGPVGGLVYAPGILFSELSCKMMIFQCIRNLVTWLQFGFSSRVRLAYRAAMTNGKFIAATPDIGERFQARYGGEFQWIPETGCDLRISAPISRTHQKGSRHLKILWLGGLIDIKPLGILLDAIAQIPEHQRRISLTVVGDGDARERYERQAKKLSVGAEFLGWVSHLEAKKQYGDADIFVLLSLKDLTTNVVFESLSSGVPVICLDHHGYSYVVDESCGRKIPLGPPKLMRSALARELLRLVNNPDLLSQLQAGAALRASSFTWDKNAQAISALYKNVASQEFDENTSNKQL